MSKFGLILLISMASTIVAYPATFLGGLESFHPRIARSADPDPGHNQHHSIGLDGFVGLNFGGGNYDPGYASDDYHHNHHHHHQQDGYHHQHSGYDNNHDGGYHGNHGYGGHNHGYDGQQNYGYVGYNPHGHGNDGENYHQQFGTNSQAQSSAQSGTINTPFGGASFANANAYAG